MHELNIVNVEMPARSFSRGERVLIDVDTDDADIRMLQRCSEREAPFVPAAYI